VTHQVETPSTRLTDEVKPQRYNGVGGRPAHHFPALVAARRAGETHSSTIEELDLK